MILLLLAAALGALYVPTYLSLWNGIWATEDQGHGPLILLVILYLIWSKRNALAQAEAKPRQVSGWIVLLTGLVLYVIGRSQDILLFEIGSHIPVLAGTILIVWGRGPLRALWFPLLFFVFMIPLPGILVDAITGALKRSISALAEYGLYFAGYPIARSGVTLTIGQYQLLVADACSGLHSLYSLSALGVLFLYLGRHRSVAENLILGAAILPIAYVANVVRVMLLVLITFHFGDAAGQGFLHDFTGIVLFVAALMLLIGSDWLLGVAFKKEGGKS